MKRSVELGRLVRELREAAGLSQTRLADAARIHRTHLGSLERGERSCTVEVVDRIATALGVEPADLFARTQTNPSPAERLGRLISLLADHADPADMARFEGIARLYFAKRPKAKGRGHRGAR